MQFSPVFYYVIPLEPNILLNIHFEKKHLW
jgi:hypothetical protein